MVTNSVESMSRKTGGQSSCSGRLCISHNIRYNTEVNMWTTRIICLLTKDDQQLNASKSRWRRWGFARGGAAAARPLAARIPSEVQQPASEAACFIPTSAAFCLLVMNVSMSLSSAIDQWPSSDAATVLQRNLATCLSADAAFLLGRAFVALYTVQALPRGQWTVATAMTLVRLSMELWSPRVVAVVLVTIADACGRTTDRAHSSRYRGACN